MLLLLVTKTVRKPIPTSAKGAECNSLGQRPKVVVRLKMFSAESAKILEELPAIIMFVSEN